MALETIEELERRAQDLKIQGSCQLGRQAANPILTSLAFLGLMLAAAAFRFPRLAERPMHCDEAVHADRFGLLLERGRVEYSTADFHGPALYYLSLPAAWMAGVTRYTDLSEVVLRA